MCKCTGHVEMIGVRMPCKQAIQAERYAILFCSLGRAAHEKKGGEAKVATLFFFRPSEDVFFVAYYLYTARYVEKMM